MKKPLYASAAATVALIFLLALKLLAAAGEKPHLRTDDSTLDRSNHLRVHSYADVLDKVTPAVVGVYTSQLISSSPGGASSPLEEYLRQYFNLPSPREGQPDQERKVPSGVGSGVIVSPNGYILTNNHVVTQDGNVVDEIVVKLTDGREFKAQVIGADAPTDVAVLKINVERLPSAVLTDSNNLRVGDVVFAIGNPLQVGTTVTMGIVSATGRTSLGLLGGGGYENFIQTDASINMGNSGGALVDAQGRLIGINTAIMSRSGGNIGLGFSIPINLARNVMGSLVEKGVVERGAIGVMLEGMSLEAARSHGLERPRGALVRQVVPGKAGAKAGLRSGDVILKVDGRDIENFAQLRLVISQKSPGTRVQLDILRDKKPSRIPVVLGSLGGLTVNVKPDDWPIPGLELESATAQYRSMYGIPAEVQGLVVSSVHADYDYGRQITEGTVICEINGEASSSVAKARQLMHVGVNRLYIWRKGTGYRFVAIRKE